MTDNENYLLVLPEDERLKDFQARLASEAGSLNDALLAGSKARRQDHDVGNPARGNLGRHSSRNRRDLTATF